MAALLVLVACALALGGLGAVSRLVPGRFGLLHGLVSVIGTVTSLAAPASEVGGFGIDGLNAVVLAALFAWGGCRPASGLLLAGLVLATLAQDLAILVGFAAAASLVVPAGRLRAIPLVALAASILLLSWHGALPSTSFAAIRSAPPETWRGTLVAFATLTAAGSMTLAFPSATGGLLGVYLAARILLDLCGPATPGWWGVPMLLLAGLSTLWAARRCAGSTELAEAGDEAGLATMGMAACGLGIALLARGADLPQLAALGLAGALLVVLGWAAWGALLALAARAIEQAAGTPRLDRLGGLLPRMPGTGLALLIALASMGAIPVTSSFAGVWLVLQAVLGAARVGGSGPGIILLLLIAGVVCTLALTLAVLAGTAVRLAGMVLLGAPRTAKTASAREAGRLARLSMATIALAALALGICPWLGIALVQPGVRLLAHVPFEGGPAWSLSGASEGSYAAPAVALLLAGATAATAWAKRGPNVSAPAWRGGLAEDGPIRLWTARLHLPRPPALTARLALSLLALGLAAAIGWAAR